MGASWSGCCCCVDSKRSAVEIGDGTLGERLLDPSAEKPGELADEEKGAKTVVNDAWLLQVEEAQRAASERQALESGSDQEDGDAQQVVERKTAWDLSEEGDGDGQEPVERTMASSSTSGSDGDDHPTEIGLSEAESGSWRRLERFSSRSTKDSYASATDRDNGSMLFRESLDGGTTRRRRASLNKGDNDDSDDAEDEDEDDGDRLV